MRLPRPPLLAPLVLAACAESPPPAQSRPGVVFTEVASEVGLVFEHEASEGAFTIVEVMGPGGALFDADGDGDLDAYLVQGGRIYRTELGEPAPNRFFRNEGGRFRDDTQASGAGDTAYGIGCAAADYDNDGDTDLYLTNVGPDVLLENDGSGRFRDVTEHAGLGEAGCSSSAAFLDYDDDGLLDLYVAVYVPWTPEIEIPCFDREGRRDYCHPMNYPPAQDRLYRNRGDGTFADATEEAGIGGQAGYGLGVVAADFDGDGRIDVYVANDKQANLLWINAGGGRFREMATELGCAYNGDGTPEAGMGLMCEDLDVDGDFDILVTHFLGETNTFYRNEGGSFVDATAIARFAAFGVEETSFGVGLLDAENDGTPEIFIASGAVLRKPTLARPDHLYAERNLLLRFGADGRCTDVTDAAGPGLALVEMSRGAVFGDYDEDGDVDILVCNNRGPAQLLRNDSPAAGNHWIRIDAVGTESNRDGIGAVVSVTAGERRGRRQVTPHYSYASSSDVRAHFGLGPMVPGLSGALGADVVIEWPSGLVEQWRGLAVDRVHALEEGSGSAVGAAALAPGAPAGEEPQSSSPGRVRPPRPSVELAPEARSELDELAARTSGLASAARLAEALPLAEQWVERARELGGYDHPHLVQGIVTRSKIVAALQGPAAAEALLRRETQRYRAETDADHPALAIFAVELAGRARALGRVDEAGAQLEEALRICEICYGPKSREVADRLMALGTLMDQRSRWFDATKHYARAAASYAELAGDGEPTAAAYQSLGTAHRKLRAYVQAERAYREALRINTALHGRDSVQAATSLSQLGATCGDQGRFDEGEEMVREALAVFERHPGTERALYVATTERNLGGVLVGSRRFEEAEEVFERALRVYESQLGPDHASTLEIRDNLDKVRRAQEGARATPVAESGPAGSHARMVDLLRRIAESAPLDNPYFGLERVQDLRARLAQPDAQVDDRTRFQLHFTLGGNELRLGFVRESIENLLRAYELAHAASPAEAVKATFELGVAYTRLGETENCCKRNTPESCILPLRGGALHTEQEGSRQAIRYFQEVIDATQPHDFFHRAAVWLMNVAYMTLDEYPDEVPEAHRIPTSAVEPKVDFPHFPNVAPKIGLDTIGMAGGVVIDDFDGDDDLDVVTSTWDTSGQMRYFRNDGDGSFSDRTKESGLTGLLGGLNLVQADYDDDGDLDFLILRGAWFFSKGRHPNSLVRNEGGGRFRDVTFDAGLGAVHYPTQTAAWADYDNDGDLDLAIGNEASPDMDAPLQLFRNAGGSFEDVARSAGVDQRGYTKAVAWGDYDGDRYPDLYVSNFGGVNRLYRNEGDGTFTDVASELGVMEPRDSFPCWFWDFDDDGDLDIFVSSYAARVADVTSHYRGEPPEYEPTKLYRNDGHGGFADVTAAQGLLYPMLPMGSNFGDLDNDGPLDFYLGTGDPNIASLMPNLMFRNRGGSGFDDVTIPGGFGHLQKGHAVAFADLDGDGDLDVFEQMGGAYPVDAYNDALYENPGFGNHWLGVRLVGSESNRSAIGARIHARVAEEGGERSIYRHVNSGGSFGANPLRQHLGLGAAQKVERLEIFWPTTGRTQVFTDVAGDQLIEIVEGAEEWRGIELARVTLKAPGQR